VGGEMELDERSPSIKGLLEVDEKGREKSKGKNDKKIVN